MLTVAVAGGELRVRLTGWAAVFALRRAIDVPLGRVVDVRVDLAPPRWPPGLRVPGTHLPGVLAAGSWWRPGFRSFWYVRDRRPAVVVDLAKGGAYDRLVLATPDPEATAAEIRAALGRR